MQELLRGLADVWVDPASNLRAAGTAVAIVVVVVTIGALLLIAQAIPERLVAVGDSSDLAKRTLRRRVLATLSAVVGVTVLMSAVAVAYNATSADSYCAAVCHKMAVPAAQHAASAHREVSCIRCHEGRKWKSMPRGIVQRLGCAYASITGRKVAYPKVPQGRCLECHSASMDLEMTARNGEMFRHGEFLEPEIECQECHGVQGHEPPRIR